MNLQNVKLVSGNMAPYRQKWYPIITPLKKNEFGVITGHVSWFPIMIFIKKDLMYAYVNLFNKYDEM